MKIYPIVKKNLILKYIFGNFDETQNAMKTKKNNLSILFSFCLIVLSFSCRNNTKEIAENKENKNISIQKITPKKNISSEFKKYWYSGTAEVSSYQLSQARYGEMREGKAVLIYVTEPFLADKQVKADKNHPDNIPILKLNATKKYHTGIYPYSIMTSSFYSVHDNKHATKISFSAQEWCGHVYAQLNNKAEDFKITSHSYFENEADQNFTISKETLENELWNKLRIDPSSLPIGNINIIPSLEFIRLSHKELKAYKAIATQKKEGKYNHYSIYYPEAERTLTIKYTNHFPYTIEGWQETFTSGYGNHKKELTTSAKRIKTINSPYWSKNGNKDLYLRDSLGL